MPVPAAASDTPPLAVLVLAWDEATPAVRALIEATQTTSPVVDSILVMVPQAEAPNHLSAEEYLPVPLLAPELPLTAPLASELLPSPVAEHTTPAAATSLTSEEVAISQTVYGEEVTPMLRSVAPVAAPPLTWSAVRVLRLGSLSLPQLAQRAGRPLPAPSWTGLAATPMAPYLGTTVPANPPELGPTSSELVLRAKPVLETSLSAAFLAATKLDGAPVASPAVAPLTTSPRYEPTEAAQAPDPEADLQPGEADEPVGFELPAVFELSSNDLVEAEADTTQPTPRPAAQAGWPEALAALRQPASLPEPLALPNLTAEVTPATAAPASVTYPALRPATTHYPAPDLNFQIIQYARFAVPVALVEPAFAVVYAPAWPTWLAAQELRQRTGHPLVLHVSTLAAADDESVETATGWIAELQRQALRRADLILTETPALAQRLRRDLDLPASAVQAVPAADTEAIAQALHRAQLRPTQQ